MPRQIPNTKYNEYRYGMYIQDNDGYIIEDNLGNKIEGNGIKTIMRVQTDWN